MITPALEIECSLVCELCLNGDDYVDINGDRYITIDGKKYKVKKI